jgi:hypothetical protein
MKYFKILLLLIIILNLNSCDTSNNYNTLELNLEELLEYKKELIVKRGDNNSDVNLLTEEIITEYLLNSSNVNIEGLFSSEFISKLKEREVFLKKQDNYKKIREEYTNVSEEKRKEKEDLRVIQEKKEQDRPSRSNC